MIDYTTLGLTVEEDECLVDLIDKNIEKILVDDDAAQLNMTIQEIAEDMCDTRIDTLFDWYKEDTSRLEDMLAGIQCGLPDTGSGILVAGQYEYYQKMLYRAVDKINNVIGS